jgi:hypothetical protein
MKQERSVVSVLNPEDFSYLTVCNNNLNRFLSDENNRKLMQEAFVNRYKNTKMSYTTLQAQHEMYLMSLKYASQIYNNVEPVFIVDGLYYENFFLKEKDRSKRVEFLEIFVEELHKAGIKNYENFFKVYNKFQSVRNNPKVIQGIEIFKKTYDSFKQDVLNAQLPK